MNKRRDIMRSLGLGRILYVLWHQPRASLARSVREGGPLNQWITARGMRAMAAAAPNLAPIAVPPRYGDEPTLVGMTGHKLWFQTAFCLHSLFQQTAARPPVRLIDDGTLSRAQAARLGALFPGVTIEVSSAAAAAAAGRLPAAEYPRLRAHEQGFLLLRKLTQVHAGGHGWQLFLDADMLFHHRPTELEAWLAEPREPVFMTDIQHAYGYPLSVLNLLAGQPVPELINTGVSGLHSETIEWARMETWIADLLDRHGSSYYLEQALFALHLAGRSFVRLPRETYRVAPDEGEIRNPGAILHHYVDLTKRGFFRQAWRRVLPGCTPARNDADA